MLSAYVITADKLSHTGCKYTAWLHSVWTTFSVGGCHFVFICLLKAWGPFVNKPRWPLKKLNMLLQRHQSLDETRHVFSKMILIPEAAVSWTYRAAERWGRHRPVGPGCRCWPAWWPCWTGSCCKSLWLSGTAAGGWVCIKTMKAFAIWCFLFGLMVKII